jgi:rubrerythrin
MPRQRTPTKLATKPVAQGAFADFMARAYFMEREASERYAQLAEHLEAHGSRECAMLFRKLADAEVRHAKRIQVEMGWTSPPELPATFAWDGDEAPETLESDAVFPLIRPMQALALALDGELRAQRYFERIAAGGAPQSVRVAAAEMASEERAHAKLIESWLARVPCSVAGLE